MGASWIGKGGGERGGGRKPAVNQPGTSEHGPPLPLPRSLETARAHSLQASELSPAAPGKPAAVDLRPTSTGGSLPSTGAPRSRTRSPAEGMAAASTEGGQAEEGSGASKARVSNRRSLTHPACRPLPHWLSEAGGRAQDGAGDEEQGAAHVGGAEAGSEVGTDRR